VIESSRLKRMAHAGFRSTAGSTCTHGLGLAVLL
jgi:hypothetical protein